MDNPQTAKNELIIPVYLNQSIVFDLIAMLQGGFSVVTKITSDQSNSSTNEGKISGNFGLGAALSSLFKVDVSTQFGKVSGRSEDGSKTEERIHTPASLLYELLTDSSVDLFSGDAGTLTSGSFIKFKSTLKKPSLLHAVDACVQFLPFIGKLSDEDASKDKYSKNNKAGAQKKSEQNKMETMLGQVSALRELIAQGNTFDLMATHKNFEKGVVLTLDKSFFER